MFFSLKDMYVHFKQANEQQFDFGKSKGPLFGAFDEFLVRFQAMFNDSRYDFCFARDDGSNHPTWRGCFV